MTVASLALSAAPTVSYSDREDDHVAVREAFETVFDHRESLSRRVGLVEDGRSLRPKLEQLDDARVHGVRLHGDRAEVHFELFRASGEPLGQLVPFGIAVRADGRWRVSAHTICALVLIQGGSPCPGRSPMDDWRAYRLGQPFDRERLPGPSQPGMSIELPDGTAVTVVLPEGIDVRNWFVQSAGAVAFGNTAPRPFEAIYRARPVPELARYRGAGGSPVRLDYEGNLNFPAGEWWVRIHAADLTESNRAFLARNVDFGVTREGFVTFRGTERARLVEPDVAARPLFGRSVPLKGVFDESDLPRVSFTPWGTTGVYGQLVIAHTSCATDADIPRPPGAAESEFVGRRCFPDAGMALGAEGDPAFVSRLLTETKVERPAPTRRVELRDVRLGVGEHVSFGIHPSAQPGVVRSSQRGLEICQASLVDGEIDLSGGSWPGNAFDACRPLDDARRVEVPTTGSDSFHVAFAVRALDEKPVRVRELMFEYELIDGFFMFFQPPIDAGRAGPRLVITPSKSETVGASIFQSSEVAQRGPLRLEMIQRGRRLRRRPAPDQTRETESFGPARVGKPVTVRVVNDGARRIDDASLLLLWE